MKKNIKCLAIDLGATSGRSVLGTPQDGKIITRELTRFENKPISTADGLFWDFKALLSEVEKAVRLGVSEGVSSVSIDTWGVDYGLIEDGALTGNPRHYRDLRTTGVPQKVNAEIIAESDYYKTTGVAPSFINTVYQLYTEPDLKNKTILLMPDLFAFMLTGSVNPRAEYTIASTTGLLDHGKKDWNFDLIKKFGYPKELFPKIIMPGEVYGDLKDYPGVPIIACASHDTASAVIETNPDEIFISNGTWSLIGFLSDNIVTKCANYTNEGGYGCKITYLKNIMGMWLQNEVKRNLSETGEKYSWAELNAMLENARDVGSFIDPNAPEFRLPENMSLAVRDYCKKTDQSIPKTTGEILRVINDSLAKTYADCVRELTEIRGKKFSAIRVVGGGSANAYLLQKTAELTGLRVIKGEIEATALGNLKAQFNSQILRSSSSCYLYE